MGDKRSLKQGHGSYFWGQLKLLSGLTVSTATTDYEQQLPKASGLWPSFFNVALRATISVNATCGQSGREEYCRPTEGTGRSRGSQCGICDANNPDPEKRHPITNIVDGTNSWWQSPTLQKGAKNDRVTINLDLGQTHPLIVPWHESVFKRGTEDVNDSPRKVSI
uniref:Laminin N-terminal domain-containing protein n=1 Tax=Anopheles minimus TaxID=112268 RepID=A0A182W9X7_9DIPT